jgi:hypothetical protein
MVVRTRSRRQRRSRVSKRQRRSRVSKRHRRTYRTKGKRNKSKGGHRHRMIRQKGGTEKPYYIRFYLNNDGTSKNADEMERMVGTVYICQVYDSSTNKEVPNTYVKATVPDDFAGETYTFQYDMKKNPPQKEDGKLVISENDLPNIST